MKMLERYNDRERMNHWFIALMFFGAAFTGLAFFHPAFFFLTHLFGGGSWSRILHPFMGLLMALSFLGLFFKLRRDNAITAADREWRAHMGDMLKGHKAALPPVGKFNYGQKLVFWGSALSLLVLVVTGVMFWRPWFDGSFAIDVQRVAVVAHAVAAVLLIAVTIIHVYAVIWVKGTARAMTRGTVSEGWAKLNHPLWHEEMTKGR